MLKNVSCYYHFRIKKILIILIAGLYFLPTKSMRLFFSEKSLKCEIFKTY